MASTLRVSIYGLLVLALTAPAGTAAQLATKQTLTLEVVKQIAAAAEQEAAKNHWHMFVAVVDDGANLVYLERMDDAQLGSLNVSIGKARSALLFKRPTKAFEDAIRGGYTPALKVPDALPVEGGLPLVVNGKIIGAIGVSGGVSAAGRSGCPSRRECTSSHSRIEIAPVFRAEK